MKKRHHKGYRYDDRTLEIQRKFIDGVRQKSRKFDLPEAKIFRKFIEALEDKVFYRMSLKKVVSLVNKIVSVKNRGR